MNNEGLATINSRLARRVIFYFILASAVITIFTSSLQIYAEFKKDVDVVHADLDRIEKIHLPNIISRMWVLDSAELETSLNTMLGIPAVKHIVIYDQSDLFLAVGDSSFKNPVTRSYPLKYRHLKKEYHIGTMVVRASLDDAYQQIIDRAIVIISSNALKTIIVSGIMLLIFYHLVVKRILLFSSFARGISFDSSVERGGLEQSNKPEHQRDELDLLQDSLSLMQRSLKNTTEDLRKRERDIATTLDSIADAVISTDETGKITHMNPVAENISGYSLEHAQGQFVSNVFPLVDVEQNGVVDIPVIKVLATGQTLLVKNEVILLSRRSKEYYVTFSVAPIRDSDGNILGAVLVFNNITEQFKLREAASKTKRDLQALMDHSPAVIYIKDLQGKYMFVNQRYEDIFSLKREQIVGNTDYELFSKEYADVYRANDMAVIEAGHAVESEEIAPLEDGDHFYVSVKFPLIGNDGKPYAVSGISTDITERKLIERELKNSEERYRTLVRNLPGITYRSLLDDSSTMLFISSAIEELSGYPATDFIEKTRTFISLIHPDDLESVKESMNKSVATKNVYVLEYRIFNKDQSIRWVYEKGRGIYDDKGDLLYLDGVILDITSEREARDEVRRKAQEQNDILNCIVDPVITIDENSAILSFNSAAEELFGYSEKDIIGKPFQILMPEKYSQNYDSYVNSLLASGIPRVMGAGRVVEGQRKDKSTFPVRLSVAEIPKDSNGKRRFIGSCVDLTQLKQQEEQIRRTQKMDALGKLSGGVAHDYNNLIGIIMGYSEMLGTCLNEGSPEALYASEIHHAAERGSKLTQKLLAFSKQRAPDALKVNLNQLLKDNKHMLEKTLTARIKLEYLLEDELWPVWVDGHDLEDAILNISINAMHAIEGNGEIKISTANRHFDDKQVEFLNISSGDYVVLTIKDSGCGMDQQTMEKIFEPFYSTKGERGTGLGMSQVYGFVERSYGDIQIDSAIGKGTSITIYFPRHVDKTAGEKQKLPNEYTNLQGKETILVVDDEPALLKLAQQILRQKGYNAICAENGDQALYLLDHEPVDLVITDVIMPEMNGYKLAALAREKYPDIKIQMVSGYSEEIDKLIIDSDLHENMLQKPYNAHVLLKTVRKVLDAR